MKTLEPRKGPKWVLEATAAIARIQAGGAYITRLTNPSCSQAEPPGLIVRTFHFTGKGRDVTFQVKLHAQMMVALLKVLRKNPGIQVTQPWTSAYSGCYRTFTTQDNLYEAWIHHAPGSHLAANPCSTYHRTGRAVDCYMMDAQERADWSDVRIAGLRVYPLYPQDPPHVTLGARG
jgi:hypothetical protein